VYAGSCVTGGAVFSMTGGDTSAIGKVAGSVTFGGLRRNYLGNPRSYLLVELIFDGSVGSSEFTSLRQEMRKTATRVPAGV
jgi:hypothetical protein